MATATEAGRQGCPFSQGMINVPGVRRLAAAGDQSVPTLRKSEHVTNLRVP